METTVHQHDEQKIEWKQFWSLAAVYASVVIGWIAYQRYQPKLLVQFNFTDFTFLLTFVQGLILVITPPIAGRLGDKHRFQRGNRLPIISAGISFAAMVFMAVAFTLLSNPGEIFRWVLPVLIVFWLLAMSIFTSPALSTIETFMPVEKLPRAMAILTIVANLLYALEPVIVDIIDAVGASATFISGGVVVFISGYALKKNATDLFNKSNGKEPKPNVAFKLDTQKSSYGFILLIGLSLGLATTVLFNIFPDMLASKLSMLLNGNNPKVFSVGILIISAILSLPFSSLVTSYGLMKSFWLSSVLVLVAIAGVVGLSSPLALVLMVAIFGIGFSALSVSTLPLAISKANYYEKVYCVGIFFAGVAIPDAIVESIQAF
ncbi:MAG: MFS transporter [Cyclobacteriaceae bacterium]|jgi:MFS family permease|nr:MFS transporter [Cytophagales bacterium]MCZ8328276.1 MFS transporter [Cyclobacteriaceae bacterium]